MPNEGSPETRVAVPPPPRFQDLTLCSFDELQAYFREGALPDLQEMTGDTHGQFLAWHPRAGWLMKVIVWVLFRRWLGKRFQPPQFGSHSGVGINLFGAARCAMVFEPIHPQPEQTAPLVFGSTTVSAA